MSGNLWIFAVIWACLLALFCLVAEFGLKVGVAVAAWMQNRWPR